MTTEREVQELLDKQAITEAIYRYARSMDRMDREVGQSVFWPEATTDFGAQIYQGTGYGFVELIMERHLNYLSHAHSMTNILIQLDGDSATSETYGDNTLRSIDADGQTIDNRILGRYLDRWEKRGGDWRIIDRSFVLDLDVVAPASGRLATTGRRDHLDASYHIAGPAE